MSNLRESQDFSKHLLPLLSVLEKPPKQRTDDELIQIVHMLKKARFFVEICKLAQLYEIKELLKHADIVRKDMGDIFNEHQSERNTLYIIASGTLWSLNVRQLSFAERIAPLQPLGQHPVWWYLADPDRLKLQFNELVEQMIKRQGKMTIADISDVLSMQRRSKPAMRTSHLPIEEDTAQDTTSRWANTKRKVVVPVESQHRIVYHTGDIFSSRIDGFSYDESNISKQLPLLFPKTRCVMIRIPELGLTQFFSKILMRLKQQELEYFRQLYIFNELSRSEVENLHQNAKIIECRRGTVIFRQGDAVNEFFVVRQGDVEISSTCPVSLISEGQLAGEVDVILNDPYRSHTATVQSQHAVLYQFSMGEYFRIIHNKPREEQVIVCKAQEKYAIKKHHFRQAKLATTQELFKVVELELPFQTPASESTPPQPLLRKHHVDTLSLVSKSIDLHSRPASRPDISRLMIRNTMSVNGYVRSPSPSPEPHASVRRKVRKMDRTVNIRINNPLVNMIELQNDRLDQIKTIKGYYNKVSKNIFSQFKCEQFQTEPLKGSQNTLEDCINEPPQHLKKAIVYLRERAGYLEQDLTSQLFIRRLTSHDQQIQQIFHAKRRTQLSKSFEMGEELRFTRYQDISML